MRRGSGWFARLAAAVAVTASASAALMQAAGPAVAKPGAQSRAVAPRVAILLLDTNNSPNHGRLAAARTAALAYANALPVDVEVGLIAFGDAWRWALQPTVSRTALGAAVTAVQISGATSNGIRPAMAAAAAQLQRLGASRSGRLVVLSNGEFLKRPVPPVGFPVDAVTFYSDADDFPAIIRGLVHATGGHLAAPAAAASLAVLFRPLTPQGSPSPAQTSAAPAPGAAAPAAAGSRMTVSLDVMLGLVFLAMLAFAALALRSVRPPTRRPRLAVQLARYGPAAAAPRATAADGESKLARSAVGLMSRAMSSGDTESKLASRLDQAGIGRQPAEWALLGVCLALALSALFTLLFRNLPLGILLGVPAGWAVMRVALTERIRRRRAAFDDQLPNVLQLIAGSIQSGFSLPQAMDAVVRENTQPASGEFSRALAETRLGIDLPDALVGVANRMESVDLRWVIMAVRIQHETGGNLAEVLRNTVATMRERGYLRRQVRTLSAEGRLSAYVLLALPILVGGWLFYSDPAYMRPLYATGYGLLMLSGAVLLVIVGAFWMRNLIRVEV